MKEEKRLVDSVSLKLFTKYLIDAFIISASYLFVFFLFPSILAEGRPFRWYDLIFLTFVFVAVNSLLRQYKTIWRYYSQRDILFTAVSILISCLAFIGLTMLSGNIDNYDIQFAFFVSIISGLGLVASRIIYKALYSKLKIKCISKKRLAIIGGGSVCAALLQAISSISNQSKYEPVCIFDDDPAKLGYRIEGIKIIADCNKIPAVCSSLRIEELIIAMPAASDERIRQIIDICLKTNCQINRIPAMAYLIDDSSQYLNQLRKVNVEDLLGRKALAMNEPKIREYVGGKTVLVTGGGGSIGSEICRQVAAYNPAHLIILDEYENNAYEIQQELLRKYPNLKLDVEIATICDKKRLEQIFETYKPRLVYHAAAHKHVPLMENNPEEAIKNNIFGTYNTIICADKYNVEKFIQISTDKAVNPTNVMGASKRFCEMIIQSMKERSKTIFAAVRFGNVLGSNGSVIPLFKKQIEEGGPVTVTHKDMTRYFMTIPEAVELVLLAGKIAESGNVYVLDMGQPVNIYDFARKMIILSGYTPDVDIKIAITGLRPGEKLYEELVINPDKIVKTENDKVFIEKLPAIRQQTVLEGMAKLKEVLELDNRKKLYYILKEVVPSYSPQVLDRIEEKSA